LTSADTGYEKLLFGRPDKRMECLTGAAMGTESAGIALHPRLGPQGAMNHMEDEK